jgi:hypothetical protein
VSASFLQRMGARVTAVDQVAQYPHSLAGVAEAFGLQSLTAMHLSMTWASRRFWSDMLLPSAWALSVMSSIPIVALRPLYHTLKPGGKLPLQSMAIDSGQPICDYEGPGRRRKNFGWNWFVPSPSTLQVVARRLRL